MSKKLILMAALFMLVFGAVNALATASRMETLGDQGLYLVDDTNVFANPAVLSYYRKCLFLHMGGLEGGDVSAIAAMTFAITDSITLGVLVGGPGALVGITESGIGSIKADAIASGAFVDFFGVLPGTPTNDMNTGWMNPLGIILSYKFGDWSLGAEYRFMTGKYNDTDEVANDEYDEVAALHDIHLGLSGKMGKMQPEVWVHYAPYWMRSDYTDNDADYSSTEKLRGNKVMAGGRLFYSLSEELTIVPAVQWEHVTGSVTVDTDPDLDLLFQGETIHEGDLAQEYTVDSLITGLNVQYSKGAPFGILITGALGLQWSKWERDLSVDTTDFSSVETMKTFAAPTAQMGIEYWHNPIVCFRGGMSTTTVWATTTEAIKEEDVNGDDTYDNSLMQTVQQTKASVGVGLHFGNMLIDATFGNLFLAGEDGAKMVGQGPNLFSHLDIKARW